MTLSKKLRADYVEFINKQLDQIPIDSIKDFLLVQEALENLIQPVASYTHPEKYRQRMHDIQDILQSPEDYVEHRENDEAFKQIIVERVSAKIREFKSLNDTQKQEYIQNQLDQRSQASRNHQIMSERQPPQPGSEAHVLSEVEWLRQMQRMFIFSGVTPRGMQDRIHFRNALEMLRIIQMALNFMLDEINARHVPHRGIDEIDQIIEPEYSGRLEYFLAPEVVIAEGMLFLQQYLPSLTILFSPDGEAAYAAGIITLERYLQIPPNERDSMRPLFSPDGRAAYAARMITLERYLQIPPNERDSMRPLFSPDGRVAVAAGMITLERYLEIPVLRRERILSDLIRGPRYLRNCGIQ